MSQETYKYYAFISYNSHDTQWGKRLQRKLEGYKMSATLCSQHGWERKPIQPVFFAPTDIQPGGLTEELKMRLRASCHLVVICSPHSAQSKWVGEEIKYFHSLGRAQNIHFFIVEGIPHSKDKNKECFHPVVEKLGMPEILGANIHERVYRLPWMNRERAYVQLITKLLGIEFDDIWQRHKRLLARNIALWVTGALLVMSALVVTWQNTRSIDVGIPVVEGSLHNPNLPAPQNIVVTMRLDNEVKPPDTLKNFNDTAHFTNVPRRFVGKEVQVSVSGDGYLPLDTTFILSPDAVLKLYRNPDWYGHIKARIYKYDKDKKENIVVPHQTVWIEGREVTSDATGRIELDVPLAEQKTAYSVTANVPLETTAISMPCGNSGGIVLK